MRLQALLCWQIEMVQLLAIRPKNWHKTIKK